MSPEIGARRARSASPRDHKDQSLKKERRTIADSGGAGEGSENESANHDDGSNDGNISNDSNDQDSEFSPSEEADSMVTIPNLAEATH